MKHNVSYSEDHPPVRSSVLQTILGRAHITPEECGKGGGVIMKNMHHMLSVSTRPEKLTTQLWVYVSR